MFRSNNLTITIDHREKPCGIHFILDENDANINFKSLNAGDYIINDQIIVERKSKDDFVMSLIQGRLFSQCANLKKTSFHQVLLIEGNPYTTTHNIEREAIKGALLSISLSWQIPIIYSANVKDSAQMLLTAARQNLQDKFASCRTGYKPKTVNRRALYFLQGLPNIGPKSAKLLLTHFGSVDKILSATQIDLLTVPGFGKKKVDDILEFLHCVHEV